MLALTAPYFQETHVRLRQFVKGTNGTAIVLQAVLPAHSQHQF